ncbi:MAG: trypsin-like peptidase domain-containing protein [Balneolaceae bacterium]
MKRRDIFLSGVLLLLIGVMIGLILSFLGQDNYSSDLAEVHITEVKRSSDPVIDPEDLEKVDSRFLFQRIAREVTPTVVYIETTIPLRGRGDREEMESEDNLWDRLLPGPRRARTVGSGVILSSDGYILTNNHVVGDAISNGIQIVLSDKRTYEGRIVGRDPSTDLAVLKISGSDLPSVVLGNSDHLEVGEWVLAIGNPFRLRSTVTAGIVSALGRSVQIINDRLPIESFIQTDAAINRGNSGGALVNTSGELIGVNTAIATQNGNYQGYGFAVPSNLALKIAGDLIEFGEVRRGMLGVSIQSVDDRIASELGMDRIRGVRVQDVNREETGIRAGDVILKVNEKEVNEANELQERVAMFRPGDLLNLTLWREGEILNLEVVLVEMEIPEPELLDFEEEEIRPEDFDGEGDEEEYNGIEFYRFDLGFTVRAIATPVDPSSYTLTVTSVQRGSEAWNRGLRQDYEIMEINGEEVKTLREVRTGIRQSLDKRGSVILTTRTPESQTAYIELKNDNG